MPSLKGIKSKSFSLLTKSAYKFTLLKKLEVDNFFC